MNAKNFSDRGGHADSLTDDERQAVGEALTEYFAALDRDIGIDAPDRILSLFDYHDSRNIDDLIDRAIAPTIATSHVDRHAPITAQGQHFDREDFPDQADSWSAASDYANKTIEKWTGRAPARADARDGLNAEHRDAIEWGITQALIIGDRLRVAQFASLLAVNPSRPKPRAEVTDELAMLRNTLTSINGIRNSIIGLHKLNWSEHVYPLVAALDAAGFEGMEYPEARAFYGTMLDRCNAAEEDAERYRCLRRGQHWSVLNGIGDTLRADELDTAIDAARAGEHQ
ncbi:hypothetical protein A3203_30885 [Burkholderia cenocepacia]|nr:hypothetical protein A3203_30885 [Burkholderia cenocepacia]